MNLLIAQTPSPSPNIPATENLVGFQAQDIVYIGSFLLLIIVILVIGLLSKKLDYALIFALILSLILIGLLWLL